MTTASRSCHRPGCSWPAAATLSYRYATGQVWLSDLSTLTDPSLYDLCPQHADTLTVPRGWERVDERTPPPVEPLVHDVLAHDVLAHAVLAAHEVFVSEPDRPAPPAEPVGARTAGNLVRHDRYEALRHELPRVAARAAASAASAGARTRR